MRNEERHRVESQLNSLTERVLKTELNTVHIRQNSAERLETINKRFDELQKSIDESNARDRWFLNIAGAALIVIGSVVFYLWMEPIGERLYELEDTVYSLHADPE